jgi:hypothetical protein
VAQEGSYYPLYVTQQEFDLDKFFVKDVILLSGSAYRLHKTVDHLDHKNEYHILY